MGIIFITQNKTRIWLLLREIGLSVSLGWREIIWNNETNGKLLSPSSSSLNDIKAYYVGCCYLNFSIFMIFISLSLFEFRSYENFFSKNVMRCSWISLRCFHYRRHFLASFLWLLSHCSLPRSACFRNKLSGGCVRFFWARLLWKTI